MANKSKENQQKENQTDIVAAVNKAELFFEQNKKLLWSILAAVVIIGAGSYAFYKWVYMPGKAEAQAQMFKAEEAFRMEDFETALNGDGNILGFKQIIEEYGYKADKSAYFYAAVCSFKAGDDEAASSYLSKYNPGKDDIMKARTLALEGDIKNNAGENEKAVVLYMRAAETVDNAFSATYLKKAGMTFNTMGKFEKALKCFETIKADYPTSREAYDIDKYIGFTKEKIAQENK